MHLSKRKLKTHAPLARSLSHTLSLTHSLTPFFRFVGTAVCIRTPDTSLPADGRPTVPGLPLFICILMKYYWNKIKNLSNCFKVLSRCFAISSSPFTYQGVFILIYFKIKKTKKCRKQGFCFTLHLIIIIITSDY